MPASLHPASLRITALLLALLLSACGGDKPSTTMTTDNGSITVKQNGSGEDGSVTITSKDGDNVAAMVTGGGAKWPATAPAYAAAYPGGKLVTTMEGNSDGKAGGMATFETTDTPDKIIAFYKDRAAAAGLTKVTTMAGQDMTLFAATDEKGDTGVSVQASVSDGKTLGSVTFSEPAG